MAAFAVAAICALATHAVAASSDGLLPPGTYVATRVDVVAAGRACGHGLSREPAFVLIVGDPGAEQAPRAIAVLRDDGGVAMPVLPAGDDGTHKLTDPTDPPTADAIGQLVVLQREPQPWLAVDYRYLDADCRVAGTLILAPASDPQVAADVAHLVRTMNAFARRDALRASGNSRAALEPGFVARTLAAEALGPEHWLTLNAGTNLASLHREIDDFVTAKALFENLIPRIAATLGSDHFQVWRARQNLALVLWDMGDYAAAEAELRAVASRYVTLLGPDDVHALGTRTNLGTLLHQRGRVVEAERIMFDVQQRFERVLGPEHPRTMVTLNNLATLLATAGRHEQSFIYYTTAVERYRRALGPRHPATLRTETSRFVLMARLGRRAEAIEGLQRVLAERREVIGSRHSETLQSQQALAHLIADEGGVAEAVELQRDVALGRDASNGPLHAESLNANAHLGRFELKLGRHAEGLERMRSAHERAARALGRSDIVTLELGALLGASERDVGDLAASRSTLAGVVEGVERLREHAAASPTARRELFARWVGSYKALAAVELALGDAMAAFEQAERSKARVLIETLALRRSEVREALPPDALRELAELNRELAEVEAEIDRAPREASARLPLEGRRTALSDRATALRRDLRSRYPRYAALAEARVLGLAESARELPQGATFVSYLRDGERLIAFTVDRRGRPVGRDLGAVPGLDSTVLAYRTLLTAPDPASPPPVWRLADGRYSVEPAAPPGAVRVRDPDVIGAELAARLIEPIPELARSRRWIVSPDSSLALVPFESLPYRGRLAIEATEISYAPSLTVYALTARRGREYDRRSDRAALYAMGDAIYETTTRVRADAGREHPADLARLEAALAGDPAGVRRAYDVIGARWVNLPQSAAEIDAVAKRFAVGTVTLRRRDEATEARLKEDDRLGMLAHHRYVLLSAHGFLSTEAPSLSAVVLGQRDLTPDADGYVTAAEWTSYTLRSDLIVISACETGAGRVIEGEGVAGLPYALFVAGNRNAMLSLWPVADRSTAELVSRFFGHLRAGRSQSEALTRTKREFIREGKFRAPLFWAPFVLWGA
jgi:CHAT domain-containing protein